VSSFYAEPSVILTVSRPIADIELNRPHKLTAIDLDCLDQLERHIEAAEVDNDVRAVVAEDAVAERAREIGETLAERSMVASRAIKEVLKRTRDVDLAKGIDIEREIAAAHMASPDVARGLYAFKSRTAPDFGYLQPANG
jgi:enoyl-CoA hydratase/carnithine racemase